MGAFSREGLCQGGGRFACCMFTLRVQVPKYRGFRYPKSLAIWVLELLRAGIFTQGEEGALLAGFGL